MFVTSDEQRGGLLAAVISGGRPMLKQRPVHKMLQSLADAGVSPVWVVSEQDAETYERDDFPVVTYDPTWAYDYAQHHWIGMDPPEPGGFLGAFPGREWACLEAERRGCWGVLQLDDNIIRVEFTTRSGAASAKVLREQGGMGRLADILAAMCLSTNAHMMGAMLSVNEPVKTIVRAGFPYSCFIEKVGEGREHWYGPYEDDILHAFQYNDRADGAATAMTQMLLYHKEWDSKTGMRKQYNNTRSVNLQRLVPEGAKLLHRASKSNGTGGARVFHYLDSHSARNPVRVLDEQLFEAARQWCIDTLRQWWTLKKADHRRKVLKRAGMI